MQKKIFITGTDTEVGKTLVSCCLVELFQRHSMTVSAVKPVAAGCELVDGQWVNEDALMLQRAMQQDMDYEKVNPVALRPAIAPHIAAQLADVELNVKGLQKACDLDQYHTDIVLVEGAGGWLVPLNNHQTLADFAVAESTEVVLVVDIKLGCINHALLTQASIQSTGLKLIGWVANKVCHDMPDFEQNIQTLNSLICAPLLGQIPLLTSDNKIHEACEYVNIAPLIE